MEIENEKRTKKKPRKIIKKKSFRKEKSQNVEEVTNMVGGLKVNQGGDVPDIYVGGIEESRSQPSSRRNSNIPPALLLNPQELTRRASNAALLPSDNSLMQRRESTIKVHKELN